VFIILELPPTNKYPQPNQTNHQNIVYFVYNHCFISELFHSIASSLFKGVAQR